MVIETGPLTTTASAEALEYPKLLALIAGLASTDVGAERVARLDPAIERPDLEERRRLLLEASGLLERGRLVPSSEEPLLPLAEKLADARSVVTGAELLQIGALLRLGDDLVSRIREGEEELPALGRRIADLPSAGELRRRIGRTLDRRGAVRRDATPRLTSLAATIRRARDEIYGELKEQAGRLSDHLSEETIPLRGGRLVLMLEAGARGRAQGLVHGRSATGRSLYFEPLEVVEGNNRLQEAVEEEDEERRRVLRELIDEVRRELPLIEAHLDLVAELDLLQAAADFASSCDGRLAEIGDGREARLVEARHPLLEPRLASLRERALGSPGHQGEVVPLNLELNREGRVLVVTGPNAGGKTVALKTLGLLALASQAGLPVPVGEGSRLPFFDRVVASVGDEQDMLAERSTFSGRLLRLKEVEATGSGALVLIDELGSGTDPEEGTALAVALLEALLEKGCLALVTTHLARLAAAALELAGSRCAAMEFDPRSGQPTYHLQPGSPGASEALALARRLGLPEQWIERAEGLLGPEQRDLRRLLKELEATRGELAGELQLAAREREDLEAALKEVERERAELETERRNIGSRLRRELDDFRRKIRQELSEQVERTVSQLSAGRRRKAVSAAVDRIFKEAPRVDEVESEEVPGQPAEGSRVRHRSLGWEGVVETLEPKRATVKVGGKRVRCQPSDLALLARSEDSEAAEMGRRTRGVERPEAPEVSSELELIGRRVEGALEELERYLDRALLAGLDRVRIVHGHGSGRLRQAVRERLRSHPGVAAFRRAPEREGGDGATLVELGG